ncbi:MAG: hypothetical protein PHI27_13820, partial [Eubacteriales bacterium]|nr:hypothetical protein [Eubacteriales bacterium]
LAVVGLLAGSGAALTWARTNARQLGQRIARTIPGDKIEVWLVAFLTGLIDGLGPESVEGVNKVLSMGVIKLK